jgi:Putative zinc-finger
MDCHDVRLLLGFVQRGCENLDATERDAIQAHLSQCPECTTVAQLERRFDEAMSHMMADVPIPSELKGKILGKLSADRPYAPWKWFAAAGGLLIMALVIWGTNAWQQGQLPEVQFDDIVQYTQIGSNWKDADVEQYFEKHGLKIRFPAILEPQAIRHVDVVIFKGQKVAKLSLARNQTTASVLILPKQQFRSENLHPGDFQDFTSIWIEPAEEYTYIIIYQGNKEDLRRPYNQ